MKRALLPFLLLGVLGCSFAALVGCASGGGGTAPSTAASAAASSAPTAAAARRGKPQRIALVEADGPGTELEKFISRLTSEASDKSITIVDARLGGGRLAPLASEPGGAAAKAFQEQWPSDAYMAITVTLPEGKTRATRMSDVDPYSGRRIERWVGNSTAETDAMVRIVDARDGHVIATYNVHGLASVQGGGETGDPGQESVLDAAERAAKRLVKELR